MVFGSRHLPTTVLFSARPPPLFFLSSVLTYIRTSALHRSSSLFYFFSQTCVQSLFLSSHSCVFLSSPPHHTGLRTRHGTRAIITSSQHTVTIRLRPSGLSETQLAHCQKQRQGSCLLPASLSNTHAAELNRHTYHDRAEPDGKNTETAANAVELLLHNLGSAATDIRSTVPRIRQFIYTWHFCLTLSSTRNRYPKTPRQAKSVVYQAHR
jgi:hypothetical protein